MVEQMLPVFQLQANKFNPNVMQPEEFEALKADMNMVGPKRIDPVLVSPYLAFYPCEDTEENRAFFAEHPTYVIVDGEHRWRGATDLKWSELRCDVEEISEEDAKGICYRKSKERGTIDPFKEAALFKSEVDVGLTQKEIAEKFIIDSSTVSHRLSLLRLVPEIKEKISMMPRGTITPSHLEPIATLPEGEQKKIELTRWDKEVRPVQDIAEEVRRIKRNLSEKEALRKAIETAKFKECPKCKGEASGIYHKGLPWVNCRNHPYEQDHTWNLYTGEPAYKPVKVQEALEENKEPQISSVIRSNFTVKELSNAFFNSIHAILPKLESLSDISLYGVIDGKKVSIRFGYHTNVMNVYVEYDKANVGISVEAKDYQSGHKSKVDIGVYQPKQEDIDRHLVFIDNAFKNILLPLPEKKKSEFGTCSSCGKENAVLVGEGLCGECFVEVESA